ncbi:MAG TPA: N-acetyl-gamma-glutamyl-phosphate reductase [Methanocorpusculum sp.]|mgnify:FL=1|jgi:N-acetyl-gamma-glutamyl-phosphate reductase|nr:N-acetyl-gamma-glutamyl-phosphate reductase [Methanocorpusculum sp.]MBR5008216.1 N-acetyl-gamma-glutamyl-phosphate reductase [Methanocorpusculum sp.]MBR5142912.1 N-acetyl-gamma-glutamyl-phosphate reductase [Methanocorpusculum sp.]MBR5814772.1 N-acetyl-gamma-glutamyl-phosphate reductase [Methanocorpusculaceae archaeon]HJJ80470.1 N-acetyl-gamma-glutamyl-phosphate reductase [Methanocorpusculum sp.]
MDIAIVGASGYAGGDLIRLLLTHKEANIVCATSRKLAGTPVTKDHIHLKNLIDIDYTNPDIDDIDADFAFLAVPHTAAMQYAGKLKERGIKTVDFSADYRLPQDVYEKTYGVEHTAYFKAPYGLPELHREEIRKADFVANPGCFPTGATLSAAPMAKFAETIIYDSKSGVSGAGDSVSETTHYPNVDENINPYKITVHRHVPEMRQEMAFLGSSASVYFTPHLLPAIRGIITTAHILLKEPMTEEEVSRAYEEFYKGEHFVRLQKAKLGGVRGSNFCDINWELEADGRRLVAVSAIDNLVKGAAGQAVQNMNIMCGFDEIEGIRMPGMFP